jgi:hypothetical protein
MKKISLVAMSLLLAATGISSAQSFDIGSLPMGNFPAASVDKDSTGSIDAPRLQKRVVKCAGPDLVQYFTVDANGVETIVSEKSN